MRIFGTTRTTLDLFSFNPGEEHAPSLEKQQQQYGNTEQFATNGQVSNDLQLQNKEIQSVWTTAIKRGAHQGYYFGTRVACIQATKAVKNIPLTQCSDESTRQIQDFQTDNNGTKSTRIKEDWLREKSRAFTG